MICHFQMPVLGMLMHQNPHNVHKLYDGVGLKVMAKCSSVILNCPVSVCCMLLQLD